LAHLQSAPSGGMISCDHSRPGRGRRGTKISPLKEVAMNPFKMLCLSIVLLGHAGNAHALSYSDEKIISELQAAMDPAEAYHVVNIINGKRMFGLTIGWRTESKAEDFSLFFCQAGKIPFQEIDFQSGSSYILLFFMELSLAPWLDNFSLSDRCKRS
jgi:hypothetical protein